jgi:hypothetical protein
MGRLHTVSPGCIIVRVRAASIRLIIIAVSTVGTRRIIAVLIRHSLAAE